MLRCLCPPCFHVKLNGTPESKEPPAGPSYVTTSTVPDMTTVRTGTVGIHAESAAQVISTGTVTASGLTSGPSVPGTGTAYVPICSPFSTPQAVKGGGTEFSLASQKSGVEPRKSAPEPALAPGKRTSLLSLPSADGTLNPAACNSIPTFYNQFGSTFSSCDQQPPSQSQTQQASLPAGTSTSTLSLQPSALLPGHIFLIQQATSSSQSAGGGITNPSLPTLPANMAPHVTHLSTGASVRSDMGTEATVRLPGELSGLPPPAALLASETSTTRLVEYLSRESVDTGVGTATASATATSSNTAKPLVAGALASAGAVGSTVGGCASGVGSRRTAHLRAGASSTSAPSSSFSLFGALQAFVEQQQGSDVAPPSATGSQGPVAAHGQGALGDHFRGFDHSALGNDNLDAPTATLSQLRPGGAGLGRPSRSVVEGNRNRRSNCALRDSAGAIVQSSNGDRGDPGNRRGSIEWLQPQAEIGFASDAGHEANVQEGIIIGAGCMGSMGSSGNAVIRARVSGPGAPGLVAAAVSSRASRTSTTCDDVLGIFGGGRPLSGPHSFEGMTSLLSGPTHTFFMDDSKGAGRQSGAGHGGNGSDTDGSRTDHAMSLVSGGHRGGGSVASRATRMQRRAERREFLLAARSISTVLQDVQILSVLGAGAHGKVYKGALKERFVAVKVILHDTDVSSVIPTSSLTGIKQVPSNSSLTGAVGSYGCSSGIVPADADAPTAATRTLFALGRSGLDISHGSGSEVMLAGGAAVLCSLGSAWRGASVSGVRPAVHPLRYQRAGSSNLHVLPLTLPGAVDAGLQGHGVASLPVLSLPGMQPVVMPHKHMLEGLISASAQHPNIVETYRIVTQLLSAPSMPAFVVTRGSQSPLWETTNLTQAAMFRLANGSMGSGAQKATLDSAALGAGSGSVSGAAGSGMSQGPAQCQSHGMVGVAQGTQDRLQRTGSALRSSSPMPAISQASYIPGAGRTPVAAGPAPGLPGPCCHSAAPTIDMPASPSKGLLSEATSAAEVDGRCAAMPTARDPLKVNQKPGRSCAVGGRCSKGRADNCAGATAQATSRPGCSEAYGVKNSTQQKETDKQKHYLAEARAAGQGTASSGIDSHTATARCDSLISTDGMGAGLNFTGSGAGVTGAVDAGSGSTSAVPLRENSTLSVSTLVRGVGSSGLMTGLGTPLGVGEDITTWGKLKLHSGDGLLEPVHNSSSSGEVIGQAAMASTGVSQPARASLDLGSRGSLLSTGVAVVSASGLAHGDQEAEPQADDGDDSKQGGDPEDSNGHESAGQKVGAGAGLPQQPEATGRQQEARENGPLHSEGLDGRVIHAGELAAGFNSREVAGDQDPDSAELILDMLGAQAALQRTASFLRRRQQQQQQQHAVQDCHLSIGTPQGPLGYQEGQPTSLSPGLPESPPWCLPSGGGPDEDIVGIFRHAAAATRSAGGLGVGPAIESKASAVTIEVASGSMPSSTPTADMDSPSGDLPGMTFDYTMAEDSGQLLAHAENFGLSTALFSTYRNSFVPTGYVSLSGRPYHRPLQLLRGSQSSVGGGGNPGISRAQPGFSGPWGGGGGDDMGAGPGAPGHSQHHDSFVRGKEQSLPHQEESAASIGSLHFVEASLALPLPLLASALPSGLPSPSAVGSGPTPSTWLPTIDELTVGVSADPRQHSLPGCALMTGRSSAGSTTRNSLLRTGSLGSGEQGGGGGGCSANVASSIGGGATRTSHGSGASMASGTGTQNRALLTSNPTSTFGGQLMPAEVHYDKLSWSNHTHTSASTSANAMLNSGFTVLLSSNNTLMTGGGSTLGGGGGGGHIPSGLGSWRRGDTMGVGGASGFRRTMTAGVTPGGTETLTANYGDGTATLATTSGTVTDIARGGAGGNGSRSAARQAEPAPNGNGAEGDLRSSVVREPLSQSFTDPRSSRSAMGARRRAMAAAKSHAMPWGTAQAAPGRERWQVLIVQELCTRGNLRDAILAGAFHSSDASAGTQVIAMRHLLDTAAEIASAMAYLHSRAIVHGDLKTANVLLQRHDSDPRGFIAKLADFGLARQLGARGAEDGLLVSRIGTVTHMAPETIRDNMVLLGSDVYSFGVILWELYCAQQPFANYSAFQLLSAVVQYDERPQFPAHCPTAYAMLAVRCMAKSPQERPTFAEVYKELIGIRDDLFGGSGNSNSSSAAPGQVPGGTLTVPLAQARREATRVLQSHLQALSGPNINQGSAHGSGILRCDATQNSDVTSGALREVGQHDSATLHSWESWDTYSRAERLQA